MHELDFGFVICEIDERCFYYGNKQPSQPLQTKW